MTKMTLKPVPIIKMLGVAILVVTVILFVHAAFGSLPDHQDFLWLEAYLVHIPQFLIPFLIIRHMAKGRLSEYGYNRRQVAPFTHKRMLVVGAFAGLLISLRYIPQIAGGVGVGVPRPVTLPSFVGNMAFQWLALGVCEETMFRGLIQTYLMNNLEGSVKMLGRDVHTGTIAGAVFWGGFHSIEILRMPLGPVVFLVALTTAMGLLMGYAYQRTGSLLTTIIVHNAIFGVYLTLGYVLYWLL